MTMPTLMRALDDRALVELQHEPTWSGLTLGCRPEPCEGASLAGPTARAEMAEIQTGV